jgi:hypothetical protein
MAVQNVARVGWWDAVDKYGLPPGFRVLVRSGEGYIDLTADDIRRMRAENAAAVAPYLTLLSEGVQYVVYTMPGGQIPAVLEAGIDPRAIIAAILLGKAAEGAYDILKGVLGGKKAAKAAITLAGRTDSKTRHEALNKAKRMNNIPTSSSPREILPGSREAEDLELKLDERNVRVYKYVDSKGKVVYIREDRYAPYPNDGGHQGPHFNVFEIAPNRRIVNRCQHHFFNE